MKKMIYVLVVALVSSVLWVGSVIYVNYTSIELRGEILGSENIYQFLSRGMLDEVKLTIQEDSKSKEVAFDILEPIEPYFSKVGFEKVVEKIKENLIVAPEEFHQLQNDAVIREVESSN